MFCVDGVVNRLYLLLYGKRPDGLAMPDGVSRIVALWNSDVSSHDANCAKRYIMFVLAFDLFFWWVRGSGKPSFGNLSTIQDIARELTKP